MVSITIEDPRQPDMLALIEQSDAYMAALYPPDAQYLVNIDLLAQPHVRVHIARVDGEAVGCAALVLQGDGTAELKRMFVSPLTRGKGVGRSLIRALEATAFRESVTLIQLETGPLNPEALGLYRRNGYVQRGPFGDYPDHPMSIFMEKPLGEPFQCTPE